MDRVTRKRKKRRRVERNEEDTSKGRNKKTRTGEIIKMKNGKKDKYVEGQGDRRRDTWIYTDSRTQAYR
jgi:hypothetical protein